MKSKLIGLLLLISVTAYSQEMINISEEKLRGLYPETNFLIDYTIEGHIKYLYTTFDEGFFCYYLDENNNIYRCMYIPMSETILIPYLNNCNSKYKLLRTFYDEEMKKNDGLFKVWKGNLQMGGDVRVRLFLEEDNRHIYIYDTWTEQL